MNKKMRLFALLIFSFLVFHGCASKPPSQQENICSIFEQKSSWYRLANKSFDKWGVIPWSRKSSAFGYTQAIDATWDWYRDENNKPLASRVNFADAIDFTGWYINKSYQINGINKGDAYNQYLAYHEGHGGFKKKSYQSQSWLIDVAKKVKIRSDKYENQLDNCEHKFQKKFLGIF